MCKIIKKKIKRSMPVVLIMFMVTSLVSTLIFNVNLTELPKNLGSKMKLSFNLPEANAGTTATTSVTVQNAPPAWNPAIVNISPGGASTTPVNVGATAVFTATADDPEINNYSLIVCSQSGATAHNGTFPTCNAGTTFCTSATTTSGSQVTCNYTNVASTSEQTTYYAYACDDNATQADCSTLISGTLYVNHAPTINLLATTDNNKAPGAEFTITATSTDPDTIGGADTLDLAICSTNSYSTTTGCAATTICGGSGSSAISCIGSTTIPMAHGSYAYYAFIKDNHGLAGSNNGASSTYAIIDVSPSIGLVTLNNGDAGGINLAMKNSAEAQASTSATSVTDNNGCTDINGATSTIYRSGTGSNCAADDDNCYNIASTACEKTSCIGAVATFVCTTTLSYHTDPTDDSTNNSRTGQSWLGIVTVYDDAFSTSTVSATPVEVNTLSALDVTETSIPYNTIKSSFDSGSDNATSTIHAWGNCPIKSDVYGDDMNCSTGSCSGQTIVISEQKYNPLANFTYSSGGVVASSSPVTVNIGISDKPTTAEPDRYNPVYWGIHIPPGKPSGDYYGTNRFGAVLNGDSAW